MLPLYRKPTLPGKILLEEFLIPLSISKAQLVKKLGWSKESLNNVIQGTEKISREMAHDLARVFGTSWEFWFGLQERCSA